MVDSEPRDCLVGMERQPPEKSRFYEGMKRRGARRRNALKGRVSPSWQTLHILTKKPVLELLLP